MADAPLTDKEHVTIPKIELLLAKDAAQTIIELCKAHRGETPILTQEELEKMRHALNAAAPNGYTRSIVYWRRVFAGTIKSYAENVIDALETSTECPPAQETDAMTRRNYPKILDC